MLLLDIVKTPYNIKRNVEWEIRRKEFYGISGNGLSEEFILNFYEKKTC